MKKQIQQLMTQAGTDTSGKWMSTDHAAKFAQLIVKECAFHNRQLSYELAGILEEVEHSKDLDEVCLQTLHRVEQALYRKNLYDYLDSSEWARVKADLGIDIQDQFSQNSQ